MKNQLLALGALSLALLACRQKTYTDLGESIFRSGKNLEGKPLLDKQRSQIRFVKKCQGCHGKNGQRIRDCDIRWSTLVSLPVPYTDSLFFRFLDQDLKSDGSVAKTGVHWNLSAEEKQALLSFLKTL